MLAQGLEPHRVEEVRLMVWEEPDVIVDISETIELKIAALACHASQMPDRVALDTNARERAAHLGKACEYRDADAFVRLTSAGGVER